MASLDVSSLLGMLSGDGVSALGKSADAKKSQVSSVLDSALPLLLTGMKNNASTKAGASSLNKALKDHAKNDTERSLRISLATARRAKLQASPKKAGFLPIR